MQRAFSYPVTVERSRTKERLEASLAGLCELELRKQRQEGLVLGALALGDPRPQLEAPAAGDVSWFSCWGQDNLTLRRQLSALQTSPWGLVQALEQQVGELRINTDHHDTAQGDTGDSRPSSGFYESSEGQSPKGRTCSTEPTEMVSSWPYTNDRPKSVGDTLLLNGESDMSAPQSGLLRSFSAPHPPLEGIAEEVTPMESWMLESCQVKQPSEQQQQPPGDQVTEEDFQQATRVEGYILHLVQRHTLSPRPCQPRTTLSPDPSYSFTPAHPSLHRKSPSLSTEQGHPGPQIDLSSNPKSPSWGCDLPEGEACGGEAPSLEEERYLMLPYPQCRPHSLTGTLPSPLPFLDPNCGGGTLNLCCEPSTPQHCPQPPINQKHNLVSAQYIPGQACHAPLRSPKHFNPAQSKTHQSSPDHHNAKPKNSRKGHNEKQRSKKSSSKTGRSQSENSLLGQRVLPERRYSTTERHQGRGDQAQGQVAKVHVGNNGDRANRRWCSNLELSQDEGENHMEQGHRRPPRKARPGHSGHHQQHHHHHNHHPHQQHAQRWHSDYQQRAPLCQGEDAYVGAAPAESSSSMSEVYSPASSSLSSDSDESGGLVWPQQLPPRLATTSSSSSPTAQAASTNPPAQPKAFVKIKASHALKKKILRFRSGSLKVMTTV
ncbi:dapper homolog 3-like isoform X1 [Corythoichthys intestinalis]|uniref:dapper homolog 3-like isoform X1 n=1 Tax=Corythoichthys intestinalis TaxID=161448 RepID=UPI0025A642C2|nr:dapper homolog 3-like isoform X1 [Corythoichthys intestinalis]XP_061796912.1 dapper homolog 3-like [Nerophis lumbriciformis]